MNEEYLSKLWNWSTSQDPTLEDRYTYDSWKQKISSNSEYQRKFYDWIQSRDETFSERRPYDQWTGMVSSKKKESTLQSSGTESTSAGSSSGSPFGDKPIGGNMRRARMGDDEYIPDRPEYMQPFVSDMSEKGKALARRIDRQERFAEAADERQAREDYTREKSREQSIPASREKYSQFVEGEDMSALQEGFEDKIFFSNTQAFKDIYAEDGGEQVYDAATERATVSDMPQVNLPDMPTVKDMIIESDTEEMYKIQEDVIKLKKREEEKLIEERNKKANLDEEFLNRIDEVTSSLIGKEEEEVVDELAKKFSAYGFSFQQTGIGDAMIVRNADGTKEITIDLDPFFTSTEISEAKKLRDFLSANAQAENEIENEDFIRKALKAQILRKTPRINEDGSESTVLMTSVEMDGKHYALPTLFPKDPNNYTSNSSDWMEVDDIDEAIRIAKERGELFKFDTAEEADKFAQGSWKQVNTFDVEADIYYKNRGLDYLAEKKKFDDYEGIKERMSVLQSGTQQRDIPIALKIKYKEYFGPDGRFVMPYEEAQKEISKLNSRKQNLLEQVYDAEFTESASGSVQDTREKFDIYLEKRQNQRASEAAKYNLLAKEDYNKYNELSQKLFGVDIDNVSDIVPENEQEEANIRMLQEQLLSIRSLEKTAALKYEMAKTYFDAKWNKEANGEYLENWEGFTTAVSDAWENGKAAEQILIAGLGLKDVDVSSDRKEIAQAIAKHLNSVDGRQSLAMTRLHKGDSDEAWKAFLNDPLEITTSVVASSLTQMLPYGLKIIPATTAAGAGAGALMGSAGGPQGTVAGAISGGAKGLRGGFAATSLALEYTNAVMDAMREKGYNLLDPNDVEKALLDDEVWSEGKRIGLSRGIPIAAIDYISGGLAGNVLKTSKLASRGKKVTAMLAERAIVDPSAEAFGEYTAQVMAGQEVDGKEIALEALGGFGNNTSNMAVNLYRNAKTSTNQTLVDELTSVSGLANISASDRRISSWANNMEALGKIDSETNQRIQENVGLRREARDVVGVGRAGRVFEDTKEVEGRVMELLSAKEELSSTQNRRELFRDKISQINEELKEIANTRQLRPEESRVNIDELVYAQRQGIPTYKIGGKRLTKAQFISKLNDMSNRRLAKTNIQVSNDDEVLTLYNDRINAIQEQTTGIVPDAERAEGIQEVEEEVRVTPESEVETETEEEVAAEDVSSKTLLEQEVEDIKQFFDEDTDPQFQLDSKETSDKRKKQLVQSVIKLMEEVQPEIVTESFTVEKPTAKIYSINVTENTELANKVRKMGLGELVGKKINLVMADQLKVDDERMGGPFFPLQEGLFGEVAWASIDENAAKAIARGAAKADYSIVYNMAPTALDSNIVTLNTLIEKVKQSENSEQIFNAMVQDILTKKFGKKGKKTEQVHKIASESNNIDEFAEEFQKLDVDTKAQIFKSVLPSEKVKASTDVGALFEQEGISQESIRRENIEQFVSDLPMGAMTMVLQITDKQGNPVTEATIDEAIITPEEQEQRGLKKHKNYPYYLRGKAVAMLSETTPFWNVSKDYRNTIDLKIAGKIKQKEKYEINFNGKKRVVKVSNNPNGTRTIELLKANNKDVAESIVIPKSTKTRTKTIIKNKFGEVTDVSNLDTKFTSSQTYSAAMRSASMTASKAFTVEQAQQSQYQEFVSKLSKAFPSVEIVSTKEEFDNLLSEANARGLSTKSQKIYGAVYEGKLYLNPALENFNTPVHEFGHMWMNVSKEMNPQAYQKGIDLVSDSEYVAQVEENEDYQRVIKQMKKDGATDEQIREYILEEALATAIGDKGESFATAAQERNFKNWLNELFEFVKKLTGISKLSSEQIQNLSLDEFLNSVVVDLMSQNELFVNAEVKNLGTQLQLMTNSSTPMAEIIRKARSEGFSDEAIAEYLKSVRKFKVKDIKEAMKVQVDLLTNLPNEFGNVEGGVEQGRKIFLDVKSKLNRFATSGPRGGRAGRVTKTMGEIRAKAQELLKANPIFQEQSETVQMQLLNSFDRTLDTRANRNVQSEINAIRNNLKQRAIGAKELSDVKRSIRNLIRKSLPKSNTYTKKQIVDLVTIINNASSKTILADIERISNEVEKQRAKMKKSAMREILKIVSRKPKKTSTGKRRGSGVPAELQSLFTQAKSIVEAVIENDTDSIDSIKEELSKAEADGTLADVVDKFVNEEKLSNTERVLMNKLISIDTFSDMNNMTLEEVEQLLSDVKNMRAVGIENTKAKKLERLLDRKKLKSEADSQIRETNKVLFNMDGTVKSKNRRRMDKVMIRQSFKEGKIWTGFKKLYSEIKYFSVLDIREFLRNHMSHLGTLSSLLDDIPNGKTFFTDNVYKPLNRMDESAKMGYFRQKTKLDELANSIDGITKGYKQVISKLRTGTHELMLRGEREIFNADQLLRIYALSKNDVQRKKLAKMGFNAKVIEDIKDICGPEAIQFADNLVDYFSNEYFDSINNVYSSVNDVNLGFVENYFPTMTDTGKVDGKMLENGDFNGIFNAETSPALKERTATEGEILLGYDFTDVVESHITQMEKYKAYAEGVKKMNDVFKIESVDALLTESGMKQVYKASINYAITPNAGTKERRNVMSRVLTKFTGFALAFKVIQIPKQATSFINAYEDYQFLPNRKVPVLDFIMFAADTAVTLATLPKQIRNAYKMSANVRDRLLKGIEGDVYGLESGSSTFTRINKRDDIYAKAVRALKTGAAGPTVLGDIMGVMGYMTNYRRDIRNGMSMEEALEKFNDYNATQQSRRGTEKISMQQNNNFTSRAFTMFGSTSFLQLNKVISSADNIWKAMKKGKPPKGKDVRSLAINYAVANVLFVGAANLAKFIKGDDEDREDAIRAMKEAASGMSIISNVPLIGAAYETAYYHIIGKRKPISDVTNPFISAYWKINRGLKEGSIWKATQPIAEIALGAQVDPFIGLYNTFGGDFNEDDVYAMLGISKSYRPSGGGSGGGDKSSDLKTYKPKPLTKTEMKEQMPEVYEMIYGENSDIYKTEQMVKDIEKSIQDDIDRQLKDAGVK